MGNGLYYVRCSCGDEIELTTTYIKLKKECKKCKGITVFASVEEEYSIPEKVKPNLDYYDNRTDYLWDPIDYFFNKKY